MPTQQVNYLFSPSSACWTGALFSSFLGQKHFFTVICLLLILWTNLYKLSMFQSFLFFAHVTEYNPNITCLASEFIVIKLTGTWHKNHVITSVKFVHCVFREKRTSIDLVHDDVQKQLIKEVETIEGVQALLNRTLEQTTEQIRWECHIQYSI